LLPSSVTTCNPLAAILVHSRRAWSACPVGQVWTASGRRPGAVALSDAVRRATASSRDPTSARRPSGRPFFHEGGRTLPKAAVGRLFLESDRWAFSINAASGTRVLRARPIKACSIKAGCRAFQPPQPAATGYDAFQRSGEYMDRLQNGAHMAALLARCHNRQTHCRVRALLW
jgi:hypothetical protein